MGRNGDWLLRRLLLVLVRMQRVGYRHLRPSGTQQCTLRRDHALKRSLDHDGPPVDNPQKGKKSKAAAKPAASQTRRAPPLRTGLKGRSVLPGGGSICFGYNLMTAR
eukprot:2401111-Amphidinium_carterae.1